VNMAMGSEWLPSRSKPRLPTIRPKPLPVMRHDARAQSRTVRGEALVCSEVIGA
jgi:hypothetical protein